MTHSYYGPASDNTLPNTSHATRGTRRPPSNNHRQPHIDWLNRRHPSQYAFGTTPTDFYSSRPPAIKNNSGQRVDYQRETGLLPEGSDDGYSIQTPIELGELYNPPSPDELPTQWMGVDDVDNESNSGFTAGSGFTASSGVGNLLCGGIPGRSGGVSVTDSSHNSHSSGVRQSIDSTTVNSVQFGPTASTISPMSLEAGLGGDEFDFNPMAVSRQSEKVSHKTSFVGKRRDPSLFGYDEHWRQSVNVRPTKRFRTASSIDYRQDEPKIKYEELAISLENSNQAIKRNTHFVLELHDSSPPDDVTRPLQSKSIKKLWSFPRTDFGCYFVNHLQDCPHYEIEAGDTYDAFRESALVSGLDIDDAFVPGQTYNQRMGRHMLYVSLQDQFESEIRDLNFEEVFNDIIIRESQRDKHHKVDIAIRNTRENRGPTVGYTSGHSTKKIKEIAIAEPNSVHGTGRLAPLFVKATKLFTLMCDDAGLDNPLNETQFPKRLDQYARKIHPDNIFELLSPLFLVHMEPQLKCGSDFLKFHTDQGNCPHWNILGCAWETFFSKRIGRWVTGTFTFCWKKSVSSRFLREKHIGDAAARLVGIYNDSPHYLREVTPDTFCHPNIQQDYRLIPIHYDPLVHLSPLLFSIDRLRTFLYEEMNFRMSVFLVYEMVHAGIVETNNMYRYSRFAQLHFDLWVSHKRDPLPKDMTFNDMFQVWLRKNYDSVDGNHTQTGSKEGSIRFQVSNSLPKMAISSQKNLRALWTKLTFAELDKRPVLTGKLFRRTVSDLDKQVLGAGTLKLQKMIHCLATICDDVSEDWLYYCLPGSLESLKSLKLLGFPFDSRDQVSQVVNAVAAAAEIPIMKAEELVCKTLKHALSEAMFEDSVNLNQPLFYMKLAAVTEEIKIWFMEDNGIEKVLRRGGFDSSPSSHYYPRWASMGGSKGAIGLIVRLPTKKNLEYVPPAKKKTVKSITDLDGETVVSNAELMDLRKDLPSLLNKNRFIVLTDPFDFAAKYLEVDVELLRNNVSVVKTIGGYVPWINDQFIHDNEDQYFLKQVSQSPLERRPIFNATSIERSEYRTENGAMVSLVIHILFNCPRVDNHCWASKLLMDIKELVILVPLTSNMAVTKAVAVIFRTDKANVLGRYLVEENMSTPPPFRITTDRFGFFDGTLRQRAG
jgi:hypothetical protein